jgi:hypothetical protein
MAQTVDRGPVVLTTLVVNPSWRFGARLNQGPPSLMNWDPDLWGFAEGCALNPVGDDATCG